MSSNPPSYLVERLPNNPKRLAYPYVLREASRNHRLMTLPASETHPFGSGGSNRCAISPTYQWFAKITPAPVAAASASMAV
jgi:hypothetical protein